LHVANSLTILSTLGADFGALTADVPMVFGTDEHEMSRGSANLCAGHRKPEMKRLGVLATHLQAVVHRSRQAFPIARQAVVDAGFHLR
jgi:hypothetical protein